MLSLALVRAGGLMLLESAGFGFGVPPNEPTLRLTEVQSARNGAERKEKCASQAASVTRASS